MSLLIKMFEIFINREIAKRRGSSYKVQLVKFWRANGKILLVAKLKTLHKDIDEGMVLFKGGENITANDYGDSTSEYPASDAHIHAEMLVTMFGVKEVKL